MEKWIIRWDKQPVLYFGEAIRFIQKDSPQNAANVKKDILLKVSALAHQPEIHPPDKYKADNTGNFRAFEIHHYRISYVVRDEEVIITRIRHTSQKPQDY